jgi:hypothetical protein
VSTTVGATSMTHQEAANKTQREEKDRQTYAATCEIISRMPKLKNNNIIIIGLLFFLIWKQQIEADVKIIR